jgi:hypothetical protein
MSTTDEATERALLSRDGIAQWGWTYTLADMQAIESLPAGLRAVVERYSRYAGHIAPAVTATEEGNDVAYDKGFSDGVEAASEAASGANNWKRVDRMRSRK